MPVDNDNIKDKLFALNSKEGSLRVLLGELNAVTHQLTLIYEREVLEKDPNDPTKHIKVKRIDTDPGTGAAFTTTRRQAVYDACIAEAERLLA